jgi:cellulose synthase/poly-beta-1,6-N-acetylglucosamine synthase-like glycosyltransferase
MSAVATLLLAAPAALAIYAYGVYPAALRVARAGKRRSSPRRDVAEWPPISVIVVAHNAEQTIRSTIQRLVAIDYPADRRQIVVVSDASTDETDRIVREFAPHNVELHRVEHRVGKTAAENAVIGTLRGDIVVCVDASTVVDVGAVKSLVTNLADPSVGVASGRVVSIPATAGMPQATRGDATYYSYEMWVRSLEMDFGAVIGATGCLYAVRRSLFATPLPPHATRDFASTLVARERGYRSVIDVGAVCYVRQTPSLQGEYGRKVRTMMRGLDTLYEFRHLLDPIRYGAFAVMLASHKLCRWLVPLLAPVAAVGLVSLAMDSWPARVAGLLALVVGATGAVALRWPSARPAAAPLAFCGYAVVGVAAAVAAWSRFLRGEHMVTWEPTRRAPSAAIEATA